MDHLGDIFKAASGVSTVIGLAALSMSVLAVVALTVLRQNLIPPLTKKIAPAALGFILRSCVILAFCFGVLGFVSLLLTSSRVVEHPVFVLLLVSMMLVFFVYVTRTVLLVGFEVQRVSKHQYLGERLEEAHRKFSTAWKQALAANDVDSCYAILRTVSSTVTSIAYRKASSGHRWDEFMVILDDVKQHLSTYQKMEPQEWLPKADVLFFRLQQIARALQLPE